ncbi:MAG: helix-turn-helix transcriptional regulator, partial [Clostridia bacterium]|nr:helix-turn-helix transcriptional regulator [Clostridia bacterium]
MNFRERLKELLEEKQIKYNSVAQQTEIPVTTLSNYINRGSIPSAEQLIKLANYFNCSIDYLVGR